MEAEVEIGLAVGSAIAVLPVKCAGGGAGDQAAVGMCGVKDGTFDQAAVGMCGIAAAINGSVKCVGS